MPAGREALAEALRATTVMMSAPGRIGTGFFVAAGQILTCAHVIASPGHDPPARVAGQWADAPLELEVTEFRPDYDLALLTVTAGPANHPVACLAAPMEPGDELWAYGHPDGAYRRGDVIRSVYDGPSVNADGAELLRITEGRAVEGFSGGPVLNWRTGGVCGVLRRADSPSGGPPGARLVGAELILEVFPRSVKPPSELSPDRVTWIRLLDDAQLSAGRWCYPGPRLRRYLETARVAARDHPYKLALPNAPQLSAVYLRQQASRVVGSGEAAEEEEVRLRDKPVPADLVLAGDQRCAFVIGGPGTGKSSLLRYLTETGTGRWLDAAGTADVPILVPAGALAADRPLAEALADGVMAALGARLADRRLADLFEEEPLPGISWVILVDGLDEILVPERRQRVLETVLFWRTQPSPYRFLVASRPLPHGQLDVLHRDKIRLYDIEPFSQDQLPEFARRWFSALKMPGLEIFASAFIERLADSQLGRLAEIPLIATMLCVVFASQGGRDLPPSRVALYEEFIAVLMTRRHIEINALERLQQWIRPYGKTAEQAVDQLLAGLRPLLQTVASQRLQAQGPETVLDSVITQVRDLRPAHMPEEQWRNLVEEALRLSGLVVERSGQLAFFHYTIEEYLAVCSYGIPADIVAEVMEQQKRGRNSFALLRVGVLVGNSPGQARQAARALFSIGLPGLTFLAALVHDGVQFPDDILVLARERLELFSAPPDAPWWTTDTYEAAEALALIDPELGFRYWEQFASDDNLTRREVAVGMMIRISYSRAVAILEPVALKPETPLQIRQSIVYAMTVVNRQQSDELLAKMAMTPLPDSEALRWAAGLLCGRMGDSGEGLLAGIAGTPGLPGHYRRWAAELLIEIDVERGVAAVIAIALDRTVQSVERFYAALTIIKLRDRYDFYRVRVVIDSRRDEMLAAIALDPASEALYRIKAARELMETAPRRAEGALALIAKDRYVEGTCRAQAAARLAEVNLPRAVAALAAIAADPVCDGDGRRQAAIALAWISRPRAAIALLEIAADRRVDAECRAAAAHQLDWIDREALFSALQIIAYDKQMDDGYRTQAALRLTRFCPERGQLALEALAAESAVSPVVRLQLACQLAALESGQAASVLACLSGDRSLSGGRRLHAAMECGMADPLAVLAGDVTVEGGHRVRAAFELAALDRGRGIEALAALSADPATDDVRQEVARAESLRLKRAQAESLRRPYGADVSEMSPEENPSYRVQAASLLLHYDRPAAVTRLMALARDPDFGVSSQAITVLAGIARQATR